MVTWIKWRFHGAVSAAVISAVAAVAFTLAPPSSSAEGESLLVRQDAAPSGASNIAVLLDGVDITREQALTRAINAVTPLHTHALSGLTRSQVLTLAQDYVRNNILHTHLGRGAAQLTRELGLNGAVVQLVQRVSMIVPATGELEGGRVLVEGYTFALPTGDDNTTHGGARLLPDNPRHIVAHYFPAVIDEFWLEPDQVTLASEALATLATVAAHLSDSLVYSVIDSRTGEETASAVTLRGYGISLSGVPTDPAAAVPGAESYLTDGDADILCISGVPPEEITRTANIPNGGGTVVADAPVTAAECPSAGWTSSAAGAPRSVAALLDWHGADFAMLIRNGALEPAEWQQTENEGELFPVTRVTVASRTLLQSCFHTSYRQTERETMPLASEREAFHVLAAPEIVISPMAAERAPAFELALRDTVHIANDIGDPVAIDADGDGVVSLYQPYRFGNNPPTSEHLAQYAYDSEAGVFTDAGDMQLPAMRYSLIAFSADSPERVLGAESEGGPYTHPFECVGNSIQQDQVVLKTRVGCGWRSGTEGETVCIHDYYTSRCRCSNEGSPNSLPFRGAAPRAFVCYGDNNGTRTRYSFMFDEHQNLPSIRSIRTRISSHLRRNCCSPNVSLGSPGCRASVWH